MLNPKILLKCHEDLITLWIHMYNKEKQWIISLTYMFGLLAFNVSLSQ